MHDLMEILKECDKRNESGGRLTFVFGEDVLNVDIEFSVEEKKWKRWMYEQNNREKQVRSIGSIPKGSEGVDAYEV